MPATVTLAKTAGFCFGVDRAVKMLYDLVETGAPVCGLDPITTGPADPPLDYYETIMIRNYRTLQEALQ